MASPFDIFRKNQKVLMALLVGFAMFAFIAADSIDAKNFPIFLGAIFGALGLWLLSGKGGAQGWAIAAVGAVLGAVVGVYGPTLLGGNAVVRTAQGDLSRQDIERLLQRQDQANQFLFSAAQAVRGKLPEAEKQRYAGPTFFGFGGGQTVEGQTQNALMNFLFQREADELGVTLDDAAVMRYLNDVFEGKLTREDVQRIRAEMRVGNGELIDVLREQIRARIAFQVLAPESVKAVSSNNLFEVMQKLPRPTPQELWSEYKKLETKVGATAVPVPAEPFVSQVPEPSQSEIAAFFEPRKSVPSAGPDAPGFLVPRQFQVAYVELDMESVRKSVTPPTEQEVMAYYQANQSQFEFEKTPPGGAASKAQPPVEASRPEAAGKPAAESAPETPAVPETPAAPETGESETPNDAGETPAESQSSDEAGTPPGEGTSRVGRDGFEYVAFQEEQPAAETEAPEAPEAPKVEAPSGQEPAATPPAFPAPAEGKKSAAPSPETLNAIRESLLNDRVREAADERLKAVRDDLDRIVSEVFDAVLPPEDPQDADARRRYEGNRRAAVNSVAERMKEYANKNGLKFHSTALLSARELYDSDDYAIGKAVLWEPNRPFTPQDATPVAAAVEQSSPDQPLSTIAAQSPFNDGRFVAVKRTDVAPHVPTLEEKGVKERVVEAWKLQEARKLAKARAEELAKTDTAKTDLAAVAEGKTVTGKDGGQPLTVRQIAPFPWLRRSTMPGGGFSMPSLVQTTLPELPAAGEKFMQTVFNDLAVGETAVVPSEDGSTFYVVEVDSKTSEEELEKIREGFMKEEFFFFLSPYRTRMSAEAQQTSEEWFRAFRAKHGVLDPDPPGAVPAA